MKSPRIMDKETATRFFSEFYRGKHHFPGELQECGTGWSMNHRGDLATWDFNGLTRLVVMAHHEAIRVSILPCRHDMVRIAIHPRSEGWRAQEHPPLALHVNKITAERLEWRGWNGPIRAEDSKPLGMIDLKVEPTAKPEDGAT